MKQLIFFAMLAVLLQSNAYPASGGKGSGTYGSAQGQGGSSTTSSTSRGGGGSGGMASKPDPRKVPPLAEDRKINEQDCSKPIDWSAGNLKCR